MIWIFQQQQKKLPIFKSNILIVYFINQMNKIANVKRVYLKLFKMNLI